MTPASAGIQAAEVGDGLPPVWPPPAAPGQVPRRVPVRQPDGSPTVAFVREVRLWGQRVLVADDGTVWCDGCHRLLDVEQLKARGNRHRVGLPGARTVLLPLDGSEPDPARDRLADLA